MDSLARGVRNIGHAVMRSAALAGFVFTVYTLTSLVAATPLQAQSRQAVTPWNLSAMQLPLRPTVVDNPRDYFDQKKLFSYVGAERISVVNDGDDEVDLVIVNGIRINGQDPGAYLNEDIYGKNGPTRTRKLTKLIQDFEIADMNGDGLEDYVIASKKDSNIGLYIFEKDPETGKYNQTPIEEPIWIEGIAVCDLDMDGDQDILATSRISGPNSGRALYLFENVGPNFKRHSLLTGIIFGDVAVVQSSNRFDLLLTSPINHTAGVSRGVHLYNLDTNTIQRISPDLLAGITVDQQSQDVFAIGKKSNVKGVYQLTPPGVAMNNP